MSQQRSHPLSAVLAQQLSRRLVLKATGGLVALAVGCGEEAVPLVEPDEPPYPLDTEGDDEMPAPAAVVTSKNFNKVYDPLLLYSQIKVMPGAGSGPNVAALVNPHGLPMELLEVMFTIYPNPEATSPNPLRTFSFLTGMSVGVKMDLGNIPVVDADVPVNAFGTSRDDADIAAFGGVSIYPDPTDTDIIATPFTYRWRLKFPLFIPPGAVLTPVFTHLGQNQFPVTVQMIYNCRTLPVGYTPPAEMFAPWVGSYNSVSFDNMASEPAGRDFSSELDIINPFQQPLSLARLTGRVSAVFNESSTSANEQQNVEDISDHRFRIGKLRIRSRSGDEVARSPTVFNGLFPSTWRAWDIPNGWTLRPGEFYKVQLTVDQTSATAPAAYEMGSIQYAVSAVGYRKLPRQTYLAAAMGGA